MYTAIKALLVQILNGLYNTNEIFQAYQNNYPLPTDSQFIIMTQGETKSLPLMINYLYDPTNEIDNYITIDATDFQVDFYGSPSNNACNLFRNVLQTVYGAGFFSTYGISIYEIKKQFNLTNNVDRDMYLQRFAVRFSLFNDNIFSPSSLGFVPVKVDNLYLAEVQT